MILFASIIASIFDPFTLLGNAAIGFFVRHIRILSAVGCVFFLITELMVLYITGQEHATVLPVTILGRLIASAIVLYGVWFFRNRYRKNKSLS